ncbi:MAG: transketolase, partial [Candidatus Atribacteria bacterium]|nr:transketolase [Candidatus Atribacteria bacterium]MCK4309104.1 transketolase [Candidatus Atribacteria bacterium]
ANIVRGLSIDTIEKARSGHPGLPLGCGEIGAVLLGNILKYDPTTPNWPDRDRFVLSAGHGSSWLYSLLYLSGYDISLEDLKKFRQLNSKTPGHPEYGETPGVEVTTGPLGQGFANAVGMALAEKMLAARFNTDDYKIIDHYTYTLLSDGCMMEGITSEAASLAGHLGLEKLIAIYDDNKICLAGETKETFTESVADRFKAYGWRVIDNINGHKVDEVKNTLEGAKKSKDKPILIIAKTHIGFGAPTKQDSYVCHGAPLGEEETRGLKKNLGLPVDEKFYISSEVREFFESRKKEVVRKREEWQTKFEAWSKKYPQLRKQWDQALNLAIPQDLELDNLEIKAPLATRKASAIVLNKLADKIPYLIGGSADLAPSTKAYLDKYKDVQKGSFKGRNIRFGVREHAMGAITNGIAAHKGFRPYCATFFVFSDYMRPAIRMAALMKLPVIYIFTHDSIFVGEDGPTHQPVEHLESLRTIPNLKIIRPADEEETKLAWREILKKTEGPTALVLSRQNLPHLKKSKGLEGFSKGGYIVTKEEGEKPEVVLMASGSEVSIAVEVSNILKQKNISNRVVSVPDREEFIKQGEKYIEEVLGPKNALRVVIEASTGQGWHQILNDSYYTVFIKSFGKSAPAQQLADCFGFSPKKIADNIIRYLSKKANRVGS